jgi:hypothetical protein
MNTWKVEGLRVLPKVDEHENVVAFVEWSLGPLNQVTRLTRPSSDFIPLANLTEEVVLNWVWNLTHKKAWEQKAAEFANSVQPPKDESVPVALPWAE